MFDTDLEDPQQKQDSQIVNGFRIPIPAMDPATGQPPRDPRLGAMSTAAPPAPSAPVRTNSNPAPGMDIPNAQPQGSPDIQEIMRRSSNRMPPAPPQSPQIPALIEKRAQLAQPTDRNAVGPDGKPMYKMGWKGKLLGTAANFASGMGHGGVVVDTSPGATNRKYDIAEQERHEKLAGADTEFNQRSKLEEDNRKLFDSATKQAYESQLNVSRQETADARKTTAEAQAQKAATDADFKQSKMNPIDQRITDADKQKLTGADRKYYIANGKLPEPKERQPRQPTELDQWREAFKKEHGRDPSADEIAQRHHIANAKETFKDSAAVDQYSNNWYSKQRAETDRQKANWKRMNPDASDEEAQAAYKGIEVDYKARSDQFEEQKKGYYAQVGGKGGTQAKPAAQSGDYKIKTKPNAKGVVLGSNDGGKTWYDVKSNKQYSGR